MLRTDRRDAVLLCTLDRAEKRNALHPDLIHALASTLKQAGSDASLGVVVLTGAGTMFCSGLDLTHLVSVGVEQKVAYLQSFFALFQQIYELPQPVIVAINGPAIAGGFDIAAACDLPLLAGGHVRPDRGAVGDHADSLPRLQGHRLGPCKGAGLDGGADHRRRCSEDRTRQSRAPRRVFGGAGHEAGGTAGIETEASPVRDEALESRRDRREHRSGER